MIGDEAGPTGVEVGRVRYPIEGEEERRQVVLLNGASFQTEIGTRTSRPGAG